MHKKLRKSQGHQAQSGKVVVASGGEGVCDLKDETLGEEWTVKTVNFRQSIGVIITLARACVKANPVTLISNVQTLTNENFKDM